jgi:hypothetical protein
MIAIFLAAALAAAAPDAKPAPPAAAAAKAEKPKPDPSKPACWNEPRPGSHMSQRVCGTQADLDRRSQEAHDAVNTIRDRGTDPRKPPS